MMPRNDRSRWRGTGAHDARNAQKALKEHGIGVQYVRRKVTFENLCEWIDLGYPVICVIDHDRRDETSHWMVVYGYRKRPATIYAAQNGWMHVFGISLDGDHAIPRRLFDRMLCSHAIVCWKEKRSGERVGLPFRQFAHR
jgi:hypothetical protein